jgi:predicted nucleotidyltransferase
MSNINALMNLLFSPLRQRVLALLLLQPRASFHLRELARQVSSEPGTVARELNKLAQVGLVARTQQGNQVRFQVETTHPLFEELAAMFRKTHGIVPLLREALAPLVEQIDLSCVFGSVARGTTSAGSDVDLLVVGRVGFNTLVKTLHPLQTILSRDINPVLYSQQEFNSRLARREPCILEVAQSPKLMIKGSEDDFALSSSANPPAAPAPARSRRRCQRSRR